jgi:hypothetical protein
MSRDAAERDEEMRELLRNDASLRTSARHDALVLSAARAFAQTPPLAEKAVRRVRARRIVWSAAAGVAAIVVAFALVWQVVQDQRELAVVNAEKVQLARLVARLEEQIDALEQRSTKLAGELRRAEQRGATAADGAIPAVARVLATLTLAPGAVRGEEESVAVRASPGPGTIRLQLELGPVAPHDAYRAIIARTNGAEVWSSGPLAPQGAGADRRLILDAPGSALDSGAYELSLRADGGAEDLTYYYFEVARR